MKKIAIFASGGGSNALKIIEHFANNDKIEVALIVSNKSKAGVLEKAKNYNIPSLVINRTSFRETEDLLIELQNRSIDFIALAGFLWLIPTQIKHRGAILTATAPCQTLNQHSIWRLKRERS